MWDLELGSFGSFNSPAFQGMLESANMTDEVTKAFTTGSGIVADGATGGQALRTQFLPKQLQAVSFEQNDAGMMKIIKKKKVPTTTVEWSDFLSYGGNGDGFVGESGATGNFDVTSSDDNFSRQVQTVKYMGISRSVGLVASLVQNIAKPETVSQKGATLALIAQMNLAIYDGNAKTSSNQFNGIKAQIEDWLLTRPSDAEIMIDCGGQPLDKDIMQYAQEVAARQYANVTQLIGSIQGIGDFQRGLYGNARYSEGVLNLAGINTREFQGSQGKIKLQDDKMFRPNAPLVADGPGADGLPRTAATSTLTLPGFVDPFSAIAPVAAGVGRYWRNYTFNTDATMLGTAPELPSAAYGQTNGNRLATGAYYYAVSVVVGGRESAAWVFGAAGAGTVVGATAVTTTGLLPQVQITLKSDAGTPAFTGLGGANYPASLVKFRIYRTVTPGVAPSSLTDFRYLMDVGCPVTGNTRAWDNGMYIPGADRAFLMTESKNGGDGYFLAELLPLIRRELPQSAMANHFALLSFVTPILWVPRHHIWFRNIGRLAL